MRYVTISWEPSFELDIAYYNIYREEVGIEGMRPIAKVFSLDYIDEVEEGRHYKYYVQSIDESDRESEISYIGEIELVIRDYALCVDLDVGKLKLSVYSSDAKPDTYWGFRYMRKYRYGSEWMEIHEIAYTNSTVHEDIPNNIKIDNDLRLPDEVSYMVEIYDNRDDYVTSTEWVSINLSVPPPEAPVVSVDGWEKDLVKLKLGASWISFEEKVQNPDGSETELVFEDPWVEIQGQYIYSADNYSLPITRAIVGLEGLTRYKEYVSDMDWEQDKDPPSIRYRLRYRSHQDGRVLSPWSSWSNGIVLPRLSHGLELDQVAIVQQKPSVDSGSMYGMTYVNIFPGLLPPPEDRDERLRITPIWRNIRKLVIYWNGIVSHPKGFNKYIVLRRRGRHPDAENRFTGSLDAGSHIFTRGDLDAVLSSLPSSGLEDLIQPRHSYIYTVGVIDSWGCITWGPDSDELFAVPDDQIFPKTWQAPGEPRRNVRGYDGPPERPRVISTHFILEYPMSAVFWPVSSRLENGTWVIEREADRLGKIMGVTQRYPAWTKGAASWDVFSGVETETRGLEEYNLFTWDFENNLWDKFRPGNVERLPVLVWRDNNVWKKTIGNYWEYVGGEGPFVQSSIQKVRIDVDRLRKNLSNKEKAWILTHDMIAENSSNLMGPTREMWPYRKVFDLVDKTDGEPGTNLQKDGASGVFGNIDNYFDLWFDADSKPTIPFSDPEKGEEYPRSKRLEDYWIAKMGRRATSVPEARYQKGHWPTLIIYFQEVPWHWNYLYEVEIWAKQRPEWKMKYYTFGSPLAIRLENDPYMSGQPHYHSPEFPWFFIGAQLVFRINVIDKYLNRHEGDIDEMNERRIYHHGWIHADWIDRPFVDVLLERWVLEGIYAEGLKPLHNLLKDDGFQALLDADFCNNMPMTLKYQFLAGKRFMPSCQDTFAISAFSWWARTIGDAITIAVIASSFQAGNFTHFWTFKTYSWLFSHLTTAFINVLRERLPDEWFDKEWKLFLWEMLLLAIIILVTWGWHRYGRVALSHTRFGQITTRYRYWLKARGHMYLFRFGLERNEWVLYRGRVYMNWELEHLWIGELPNAEAKPLAVHGRMVRRAARYGIHTVSVPAEKATFWLRFKQRFFRRFTLKSLVLDRYTMPPPGTKRIYGPLVRPTPDYSRFHDLEFVKRIEPELYQIWRENQRMAQQAARRQLEKRASLDNQVMAQKYFGGRAYDEIVVGQGDPLTTSFQKANYVQRPMTAAEMRHDPNPYALPGKRWTSNYEGPGDVYGYTTWQPPADTTLTGQQVERIRRATTYFYNDQEILDLMERSSVHAELGQDSFPTLQRKAIQQRMGYPREVTWKMDPAYKSVGYPNLKQSEVSTLPVWLKEYERFEAMGTRQLILGRGAIRTFMPRNTGLYHKYYGRY